jgi:hypothetical protein
MPCFLIITNIMSDHFRFVFYKKKITKSIFFFKKTETEPKSVQTDRFRFSSFRFGFLGQNPVQTGFGSVFFGLAWFFSGLARFFSVWVRFGFFGFRLIKLKPNRSVF